MKNSERAAVVRIFVDLIKADRIIDAGEMVFYSKMRSKYNFTQENEIAAESMTFSKAISILKAADVDLKSDVLADCSDATVSDGFCAHSEALLMVALHNTLSEDEDATAEVISIPRQSFAIDDSTVLYVESRLDENINGQIVESYRYLYNDFLLAGFKFVYIPSILEHYRETDGDMFRSMISFLAPSLSYDKVGQVIDGLMTMTTASFCKDILCNRLGIDALRDVNPSLLIKIGNSYVKGEVYSNFVCVEIDGGILSFVQRFVDAFSSMLSSDDITVPVGAEANSQYLYFGFYKQLLDIFLIRKNIRSRIVINPFKEEISFPDIDQSLSGLTRRDKALYALFLFLKDSNGFSFSLPRNKIQMISYNKKMLRLQNMYRRVYSFMGGDVDGVPDLCTSTTRRPIISRINKSILQLSELLYNVNDYLIAKNSYNVYNVNVESDMVFVVDGVSNGLQPFAKASIYKDLSLML